MMGTIWLYDLPDVLAGAGLPVDVWPGWETRSRGSGGYDAVRAVFAHHTASSSTAENDMAYMWADNGSADQPIGALYLGRDGIITVGAAGATNCQGKGGPWTLSTGTIPLDCGNAYGIAIEAANNGTGEAWPAAQTDSYTAACAALCAAYGLDPGRDVLSHWEWCEPSCPGRKIDPAGPSPYATGPTKWNMEFFRADVESLSPRPPDPNPPTPPLGDDDMSVLLIADDDPTGAVFWWDGRHIGWVRSETARDVGLVCGLYTDGPLDNFSKAELQHLIDSGWVGGPVPPGYTAPAAVDTGVT